MRADALDARWAQPPPSARLRGYWWWLNGNVTKEAITRDLEQIKAKGFGGALIGDAALPVEQRLTTTNVLELTAKTALMESGLFGPVRLGTMAARE